MAHDRNGGPHQGAHLVAKLRAALQLDGLRASFLDQPPGIAHRVGHSHLTAHERHVADHQGRLRAARHSRAMPDHVLQRHGQGVRMAQHDHTQRIPHQQGIDAGLIHKPGNAVVIGREHGQLFPALGLPECGDGVFHACSPCRGLRLCRARAISRCVSLAAVKSAWCRPGMGASSTTSRPTTSLP